MSEPGGTGGPPTSGGSAAGPPSGPLSGPSAAEPPTGGGTVAGSSGLGSTGLADGGGPPPGGRTLVTASGDRPPRAWWRRPRLIALLTAVVVAAAVLTVVLTTRDSGGKTEAAPQVALQPVAATGPDPFTGSVAVAATTAASTASAATTASATGSGARTVQGSDPGLYGGSRQVASCDVPRLAEFLGANPDRARAWAAVEGIDPGAVGDYLRALTSVVLRVDTRVTNHGFANGAATPYQAVLQSGTAVLIDAEGLPRVRCACGNPLLPPVLSVTPPAFSGTPWPSFREQDVVAVSPAPSPLKDVVVVDPSSGQSYAHQLGGSPSAPVSPSGSGTGTSSGSGSASTSKGTSSAPSSAGGSSGGSSGPSVGAPRSGGSAGSVTPGQPGGASAGNGSAGGGPSGGGSAG
ncbi:DUF6777 domain-containing protein [Kitasatospora sp. NPDC101801]|uniref:DUF6777 domain-containing protein n=1 Tax=Kitasatospora sp. NPDC101801 TaxID=3364103 RepID=UPI0037F83E75